MALLVYLAVEGRRGPVSRDRLLGLFWPESDESRARNALSQALHHLRQALGAETFRNQGASAVAVQGEALWCDATAFADALERGEPELALDLYQGDFCPALFLSGTPEVEQWLDAQRARLRRQALAAARGVAEGRAAAGDPAGAVRAARRALGMEPEDEADVRTLIALLDQAGDPTGALVAYQDYARRLAATLEAEPAAETRRLAETIRRRREQGAPPAPVPVSAPVPADPGPPPAMPSPGAPSRASPRRMAAAALLVLLMAVSGGLALRAREQAAPRVTTIAVLPFVVRTGGSLGYLGEGMVDLLSAKLGDIPGFHVIDPHSIIAALRRRDSAAGEEPGAGDRIARDLGAGWYVTGDVIEVAGRLQLKGTLRQAGANEPAAIAAVVGDTAQLFELVDDLTGRMLAGLLAGRDTTLTRLAAVTTHSLPALKAFLEGERAFRAGEDAQAAAAFRSAALLDTSFALAQYRLALTATWVRVRDAESPVEWAATAARHADRLTPLGRDLLTAYRAYKELDAPLAERLYRAVTESHPDNIEAWLMLGETRFHYGPIEGRSPQEAWPAFERVLTLDPGNLHAMVHLARLAVREGRPAELQALARRYTEGSSNATRLLEMQALLAYDANDPAGRAAVLQASRDADEYVVIGLLQDALAYAQNLDAAREIGPRALRVASVPNLEVSVRRMLLGLGLAAGQWTRDPVSRFVAGDQDGDWLLQQEVLLASEPLVPVPAAALAALRDSVRGRRPYPVIPPVGLTPDADLAPVLQSYFGALLSLRLGDTVEAERAATDLVNARHPGRVATARQLGHAVRAAVARARGDLRGALAELDQFDFAVGSPGWRTMGTWGMGERFARAEVLHALGRDEEALPWYESFPSGYDLPFAALSHLRQAQIQERLGRPERAAFHYGRCLALWRDADPGFQPLVAQAAAALAHLRPKTLSSAAGPSPR